MVAVNDVPNAAMSRCPPVAPPDAVRRAFLPSSRVRVNVDEGCRGGDVESGSVFDDCIQIAGVIDAREAALLLDCGVRLLGFPLRLPVHREDLSEEAAAAIIRGLAPPAAGVLITYLDEADAIAGFADELAVDIVQLHGAVGARELARLRSLRPALRIIKSLVVGLEGAAALRARVIELAPLVDAFITDTYDPDTGATGATGKVHDWSVSRALVALSPRPVILAGGLTPHNVRRAVREVAPAGVDAHTGVEGPDGRKDRQLVTRFVAEARAGFAALRAHGARPVGSSRHDPE
jgi:phosphoribosylanthranilate isomerase